MNGLRRKALLLALTAGIVIGSAGSTASASFSDSMAVSTAIATATVAPVTGLVGQLTCPSKGDPVMSATWTASTARDVSGYLLRVTFSDGFVQTDELPATATSWSKPIAKYNVTNWSIKYSVVTQTAYGWTAESPATGTFRC